MDVQPFVKITCARELSTGSHVIGLFSQCYFIKVICIYNKKNILQIKRISSSVHIKMSSDIHDSTDDSVCEKSIVFQHNGGNAVELTRIAVGQHITPQITTFPMPVEPLKASIQVVCLLLSLWIELNNN